MHGHRERQAVVTEALAHDLHGNAVLQQDRGVGVTEVVEADLGERVGGHQAFPALAEVVGVDRAAVEAGEDELVVTAAGRQALLELAPAPRSQGRHGPGVEVDRAARGSLLIGHARLEVHRQHLTG